MPGLAKKRPVRYSERAARDVLTLLAEGCTLEAIGRRKGLPDRASIYRWMRANPEFKEAVDNARRLSAIALEDATLGKALELLQGQVPPDQVRAADTALKHLRFVLAKRDPRKFGERHERANNVTVIHLETNLDVSGAPGMREVTPGVFEIVAPAPVLPPPEDWDG